MPKQNLPSITLATDRGPRLYQEDRLVVKKIYAMSQTGILLAIADGHGGEETSSYIDEELSGGLFDRILAETDSPVSALKQTFRYLNETTLEISKVSGVHSQSGTTLSIVYIPDQQNAEETATSTITAYVGIIGDSPVICLHKNGGLEISPEHNVRTNEEERKAAEERGGIFFNGYLCSLSSSYAVQLTRDIGCHAMGNILKRSPDIYNIALDVGDVIIIGSDGMTDPVHADRGDKEKQRLAGLVVSKGAEAQDLVKDALQRNTGDNVSAIVYRL